jgi:plastocyanin
MIVKGLAVGCVQDHGRCTGTRVRLAATSGEDEDHREVAMKVVRIACFAALAGLLLFVGCGSSSSGSTAGGYGGAAGGDAGVEDASDGGAKPITVKVGETGMTFTPADATISLGDTVRWEFVGAFHTVTSGASCVPDDKFCSPDDTTCATAPTSNAGASYEHTFTAAGVYPYFCKTHCSMGMTGTITVNP